MSVTKIPHPYRVTDTLDGTESRYELARARFYAVVEKPRATAALLSPEMLESEQSNYGIDQELEAEWRGLDWKTIDKKPPPEFGDGIAITIDGKVRLTNNRHIHIIQDDGSNLPYHGEISLSIREGDPSLSRARHTPAWSHEDEELAEHYHFWLYTTRSQLDFLFSNLGRNDRWLALLIDAWGFQFGPERSFARFRDSQTYYLEQTATITGFRLTLVEPEENASEPEPEADEPAPVLPPPPIDYRPLLRGIKSSVGWLTLVGVAILVACVLHH